MTRTKSTYLALLAVLLSPMAANADLISATLPEVNGGNGFIGNFLFSVPVGDVVTSATISGTFGNSSSPNSGFLTLFLDSILVAECDISTNCWNSQVPGGVAWSYTFSAVELALGFLNDGIGSLVQNATVGFTRLGSLQLVGQTSPASVPEPGTLALLGIGLLGMGAARRKKKA